MNKKNLPILMPFNLKKYMGAPKMLRFRGEILMKTLLLLVCFISLNAKSDCLDKYKRKIDKLNFQAGASTVALPLLSSTMTNAVLTPGLLSTTTVTATSGAIPLASSTSILASTYSADYNRVKNLILESELVFGQELTKITENVIYRTGNTEINEQIVANMVIEANEYSVFCSDQASNPYLINDVENYLVKKLR